MGYRVHSTTASSLFVQFGTLAECAETLNVVDDYDSPDEVALVLNDVGNMEAVVLRGTPDDFRDLAERVRHIADHIGGDASESGRLYEKCRHCHLFIEDNPAYEPASGLAEYVHLHRGDAVDTALDESHEAEPSGRRANLLTWKTYGPLAMRERFTA